MKKFNIFALAKIHIKGFFHFIHNLLQPYLKVVNEFSNFRLISLVCFGEQEKDFTTLFLCKNINAKTHKI